MSNKLLQTDWNTIFGGWRKPRILFNRCARAHHSADARRIHVGACALAASRKPVGTGILSAKSAAAFSYAYIKQVSWRSSFSIMRSAIVQLDPHLSTTFYGYMISSQRL